MMNGGSDEEDDIILDRRNLLQLSSGSGAILSGTHRVNLRRESTRKEFFHAKHLLLAVTCLCLGMFTGLIGPTLVFLSRSLSIGLTSLLWLITIKACGFLLGTLLSSYLYHWFNMCCLLGLSSLSISLGMCLLPFMLDLTSFYLTSLIVGISLGICYQGTEAFASRSFIRWLHHFLVVGAILSTALLLLSPTDASSESRPRRDLCHRSFCCVSSIHSDAFICTENNETISTQCSEVLSECGNVSASICVLDKKDLRCEVEMLCSNGSQPACSNSSKHRNKPSNAISDQDDRRVNLLFTKMHTLYLSMRWIHVIYLVLALGFFLLATFYSVLAIRGEDVHLSTPVQLHPLALFVLQPPSKAQSSSGGSSWPLVALSILFYFILAGMESSLTYLSYLFALERRFSERWSLLVQLLYLTGRLLDIVVDSTWLFFKLRSDYLSLKISILLRLIALFLLCFLHLLDGYLPVSLLFLALGYLLNSISRLVLQWIVRDFHPDEFFLRLIFFVFVLSESICPVSLFSHVGRLVSVDFTGASAVLIVLLLIMVYRSQKWQSNRVYRLLSPSTEEDEENTSQ